MIMQFRKQATISTDETSFGNTNADIHDIKALENLERSMKSAAKGEFPNEWIIAGNYGS